MVFTIYVLYCFVLYSFLGWGIENIYSFCQTGHFQEEGFLKGPYKPMYGITMALLIVINQYLSNNVLLIIGLCFLIPLIVEYLSGYYLKKLFYKSYWDYSQMNYNLQGIICLQFAIYWMILTFVGLMYLHPIFEWIYKAKSVFWIIVIPNLIMILLGDLILTIRRFTKTLIKDRSSV